MDRSKPEETVIEETFEDLYEHAPCGYVSTLPDGSFIRVNQTLLGWTGYQREELLAGKRLLDLLSVPGKIYHETHYAPLLQMQGFVNEIAFDMVCRDGKRLPVLINTVQRRDESGTPLVNRTTIFNASHRRHYERELQLARKKAEQALRIRDHFLALASHELKTPLTAILGNIQLLQRRIATQVSLGERERRTIQVIANQANRLNSMVKSLLDASRIETGQLSLLPASVNVYALVSRIVDEMQSTLEQRSIDVHCEAQAVVVVGDELRLEQVFQNLIQNALKYSAKDSPVQVMITQQHDHLHVVIIDQGIGVPQTSVPHLFDRFYRATNVQDGVISGMGIGLYVVKEIVELHGGKVWVDSIEGQGSTFTVRLPLLSL